jgi:hypothetical protein
MTFNQVLKHIQYDIEKCPVCCERHRFILEVHTVVPIFGSSASSKTISKKIAFTCPKTKKLFTKVIPNPPGGEIIGLVQDTLSLVLSSEQQSSDLSEFLDWAKNSRSIAIDYCKIMLSTSTGAIPIYFAIQKYIGFEKISELSIARAGIIPPVMFLASSILFAIAIWPQYATITETEFTAFRAKRLNQLNQYIRAGTILFVISVCVAIILCFITLSIPGYVATNMTANSI